MKKYALIVAGGSGSRMGSEIPKQFLLLNNKPVLMHTLQAFNDIDNIELIVVLPSQQIAFWKELCGRYEFNLNHTISEGGNTRFHSVSNGLALVPDGNLVAIHDGVRPMVSKRLIESSFNTAIQHGSAIAAVSLKDSLREQLITGETRSVSRSNYYLVQTPQTFQSTIVKTAYLNAMHENFTDDASVLEAANYPVRLIEGDYKNIKITTPEDLIIASALMG